LFAVVLSLVLISTVATVLLSTETVDHKQKAAQISSAGDRVLRVGWVDMYGQIATLNPLLMTAQAEKAIIWPCYSSLLTYDSDSKVIGDLARSYGVSADGLVWTFKLYESAQFYDRTNPPAPYGSGPMQPLTARDVIFTYNMIQNVTNCNLNGYLPTVGGTPVIQSMSWGPTLYDLRITTSVAYAPIVSAFTDLPILPRYIWINHYDPPNHQGSWNWANFATGIPPCVGSGFFYYNLTGLPTTGFVELVRSPTWFATEEHGWQLKCSRLQYRSELSGVNSLSDFQNGNIDIMEFVAPDQYINPLNWGPGDVRQSSSNGYVYEFNVNQMSDAMRASLGGRYAYGTNNQLLLDPVVRLALSMSVDRETFVNEVLNGLGAPADSFVPENHPYHYTYGSTPSDVPVQYDTPAARALLMTGGWRYRLDGSELTPGSPDYSTYYPLCKMGGTSPLRFRFCTLSMSTEWNEGARLIIQAAGAAGIDLYSDYALRTVGDMNGAWYAGDFDLWLWNWLFPLTSEVSSDILSVFTTMEINTWSDCFYSNATYDNLYNQSLVTFGDQRRTITDELQRMLYENHGSQPVAYKDDLFAMRASAPDYWTNWGNWTDQVLLDPSNALPWLYIRIEPQSNLAPKITSSYDHIMTMAGGWTMFDVAATDMSNLEYRWNFGDGSKSSWSATPEIWHTYSSDGYFTADVMVREVNSVDHFITSKAISVAAYAVNNSPPENLTFTYSPLNPNTGTKVTLSGFADDPDGDGLTFLWDFGDGSSGTGPTVVHQFVTGSSNVTLSVDDGRLHLQPCPSLTLSIPVYENSAPTIVVPPLSYAVWKKSTTFTVTFNDNDTEDQHRFTWLWGDGECDVTSVPTADHTYGLRGYKNLTVFCDDLTGLAGHNVSGTGRVSVGGINLPPTISSFTVSTNVASVNVSLTFTCIADDPNDDFLGVVFDFGDGSHGYFISTPGTFVATHAYSAPGTYYANVTVSDYLALPVAAGPLQVEITQPSISISLLKGWNFIGIPLLGSDYRASNIGLQVGDVVVRYNESMRYYDKTYIVGISPPTLDFSLVPGVGYWVFADAAETLLIYGSLPVGIQSVEIHVPAGGGWYPFVFLGLKTHHASEIPGMFSGTVSLVAAFDLVTKVYKTYIVGIPMTDFVILPGQAIWIFCGTGGTLSYLP
jgi:ABC-type transport system substrate-binding protein